ncbi:mechanosensitive ion channel family [Trichoderma arundinaceum]|uniref:Mechanosensitive ion channel protein n=1 Tax=Trichoderma arundinaceum TaxID=490622 RepID=A0A395NYP8_TRIAR|nr:mechanosensitive ion channel family [Trichoderma arundinaceum]
MAGEPFPPPPPIPSSHLHRVSSEMNRIEEHDGEGYDEKYDDHYDEKYEAPTLDTFNTSNTLAPTQDDPNGAVTPISQRAEANRLNDDLELLRAERMVSNQEHDQASRSRTKNRHHNPEPEDAFNQTHQEAVPEKKKNKDAALYKLWLFISKFPRFFRYIIYLIPGAALLLAPVLLGTFRFNGSEHAVGGPGGVYVMWFGIWLEIVWGSLWVTRMITNLIPPLFHGVARMGGSTNAHKWRDIGERLELHTAMFLWFLAILVSFQPTMDNHRAPVPDGDDGNVHMHWISVVNKVIIALFVLAALNFVEKILIQWIAQSFHQRTYATRIENNKADIRQLVCLFEYAKSQLEATDTFWKDSVGNGSGSGLQTPMKAFHNNARQVLGKVGHVAGRVGNDILGRKGADNNHPRRIVAELLRNTASAHTLARLIYRSVVREGRETVHLEDLQVAFETMEEAEAAFSMFDKDLNGDISVDEFEAVCNEIQLEKKAIAASLKDLDSVIKKLDKVFLFIIVVIAVIVFVAILSDSTAAGLASAGSSILGLAWMLQATAQEFLQSIIFVFIKHPFDVGDRVTIYGNTGATLTGDDYYVTEISLLYTEFKKMQGHIVQAPNSLLNTVFILNQRRSNGLSDSIPLEMKFGTPANLIEDLKARMLEFVQNNKRDYQPSIITEMTGFKEVRSCTMNMVFFHKSSFQNELLRLNRHNKFVTELMYQMVQVGIEAPLRVDPGGSRDHPVYWANMPAPPAYSNGETPSHGRPRATSSIRSVPVPNQEPVTGGFQDVFEKRREHVHMQRMASIREKERGLQEESAADVRASTTSALAPAMSVDSQTQSRSRIFGRARSGTRSVHSHNNDMV